MKKKHFKYSTNLKIIPIDWNFKSNCPLKKRGAPGKGAKELSTKLKLIQLIFEKIEKFIEKRKNQKDIKNQTTQTSEGCFSNRVLFRAEIFGL